MKHGFITLSAIIFLAACNNNSAGNNDLSDSLGNKTTDTTGRGDTAYYERMIQKTGPGTQLLQTHAAAATPHTMSGCRISRRIQPVKTTPNLSPARDYNAYKM